MSVPFSVHYSADSPIWSSITVIFVISARNQCVHGLTFCCLSERHRRMVERGIRIRKLQKLLLRFKKIIIEKLAQILVEKISEENLRSGKSKNFRKISKFLQCKLLTFLNFRFSGTFSKKSKC